MTALIFLLIWGLPIGFALKYGDKYMAVIKPYMPWIVAACVLHNVFFIAGYSLRHSYTDWCVFFTEYLCCCLLFLRPAAPKIFRRIGIGFTLVSALVAFGLFATLSFRQNSWTHKIVHNGDQYEIRYYEEALFGPFDNVPITCAVYKLHCLSLAEEHLKTLSFRAFDDGPIPGPGCKFSMFDGKGARWLNIEDANGLYNNWPIEYYHK